jgi:hypothetical protein
MNLLSIATIGIGSWMGINGLLHDIFVLRSEHGKTYGRNLLRLLMDGHILITCGAIQILSFIGIEEHLHWSYFICAAASISLLIYCAMIFPFLKSIFTILLNAALIALLAIYY